MKTYLNVPYSEKDYAKTRGARWDAIKKSWYIENIEDITPFMQWMPGHLLKPNTERPVLTSKIGKQAKKEKSGKHSVIKNNITIGQHYIETDDVPTHWD